jgi:hypothetical protein
MTTRVIGCITAREMICTAHLQVEEVPTYRLGQALYNLLPKELQLSAIEVVDHYKWYNTLDERYALKYFYDHFVKEN